MEFLEQEKFIEQIKKQDQDRNEMYKVSERLFGLLLLFDA